MEIMYPIAIIIGIVFSILIVIISLKKKVQYTNGKKVANTQYIKETEYYKSKLKKYQTLSIILKILSISLIILTSILVSRPVKIQTKNQDKFNRDIFLSLDISTSECEVNLELIRKFKETLTFLKGDRIGIVLYNTSPIVYCPLTDDYDYIDERLNEIEKQLDIVVKNNGDVPISFDAEGTDIYTFWYGGTIAGSEDRGSSLVGDGLAGTVYSFPDLKTNSSRTRIIIFATDNDVQGKEIISLEDASTLCQKYNINIYAYCPSVEMNSYTSKEKISSYKKAIEKAGGKFYTGEIEKMADSILKEIKDTKTSLLKTSKSTIITDYPEIVFIIILLIYITISIIEKRIN